MSRSIICISRTAGAGGEEVAKIVADKLGFRYVDEEIVIRAAELAGVSPEKVAESEKSQPLMTRVLDALARVPARTKGGQAGSVERDVNADYSRLIERGIHGKA